MASVSWSATVSGMTSSLPTRVVIAGGGIGGLEAMFALRSLAGYRVFLTLMTPDPVFRVRALSVEDPFCGPALRRYDVGRLCSEVNAEFVQDALASVDPDARTITTGGGRTVPYDDLVLARGALQRGPFAGGITFRGLEDAEAVHGLIQDVELGAVESVVFVVPSGTTWPLPLYELALLTAERAFAMGVDVALTLVTPEERPLGYFGLDASATVTGLLRDAGITLVTETHVRGLDHGTAIGVGGTPIVQARRAVTIPVLEGRRIPGIPTDARGFVPVDEHGGVIGLPDVWAVGDGTTFPLKQGGLAAQQADAAAAAVAAGAGASGPPTAHPPPTRGRG